ncbi:MAG: ATP synthase F1 subunit delta [Candidatus Poribacteria bacterium]
MSIAYVYAKALYEVAKSTGISAEKDFNELEKEINIFLQMTDSSAELSKVLHGPLLTAKERVSVIAELSKAARFSKLFTQFLLLLARKGRVSEMKDIKKALYSVMLSAEGGILGHVIGADPIDERDLEGLALAFSKRLGRRVAFQVSVDPELLAGMKVTVSGITYDGSLRAQIQRLRDQCVIGWAG